MVIYYLGRVCACFIVTRFTFELNMNIRQINLIYSLVVKIHNIIKNRGSLGQSTELSLIQKGKCLFKLESTQESVQSCPSYKKENVLHV